MSLFIVLTVICVKTPTLLSSELPVLKNQQVTQAAVTSVSSQHVGSSIGLASQCVEVTTQPYALSSKPQKPNFFCSLNSENSSLETSWGCQMSSLVKIRLDKNIMHRDFVHLQENQNIMNSIWLQKVFSGRAQLR